MTETALTTALAELEPLLLDDTFVLLGYARGFAPPAPDALAGEAYTARIDDPFETTLVVRTAIADALPEPSFRVGPLRSLVLTAELPAGLPGFLSVITGAFAERGITVIPITTTTRCHLLLPDRSWPEALAILRGLRDAARSLPGAP